MGRNLATPCLGREPKARVAIVLNEPVSMMERDLGCSMEILYERCESWFCKGIGEEISGERRDEEKRNIYDVS